MSSLSNETLKSMNMTDSTTHTITTVAPDSSAYQVYLIIGIIIIVIVVVSFFVCAICSLIDYFAPEISPAMPTIVRDPDVIIEKEKSPDHLHILKVRTSSSVKTVKNNSEMGFSIKELEGKDWNKPIAVNSNTQISSTDSDEDIRVLYKNDSSESLDQQKQELKPNSKPKSKLRSKTNSKSNTKWNFRSNSKLDSNSKLNSKTNAK